MTNLLDQLASTVSAADDLETLTRPMLELLELVTGLESTYLTTIDEGQGVQHILYARNTRQMQIPEGLSVPWGDTLCKRALDENRPYTDDVASCWGDSEAAKALGIQTYLSQPVRNLDGGLYGTLCAASAERRSIETQTLKVPGLFARLIAQQVDRERLLDSLRRSNEELATHALSDPLTGVANRRALIQELKRMLARARRELANVQVAYIDLDGFKAINDRYGHEVGDSFLVQVASRLAGSIRACDFVARIGGDEFVVLAYNASLDGLRDRIERMTSGRYRLHDQVIDYGGASVGIAVSTPDDSDPEALLARADASMYETKLARKGGSPTP